MSSIDPNETPAESIAAVLGPDFDPDAPLSLSQIAAVDGRRLEVKAARQAAEEAEASQPRPETPDPLAERRTEAARIRSEAEERASLVEDARTLLAHEHPGLGDVSDLTDDEAIALAFPGASGPTNDDLANDLQKNLEASEKPSPKWTGEDRRPDTQTHETEGA